MRPWAFVSLVLFAVACGLPALRFDLNVYSGPAVLLMGWAVIAQGVIAWYANPIWLFGLVMAALGKTRVAAMACLLALTVGCSTLLLFHQTLWDGQEGGHVQRLQQILPGGYAWLASLAASPLGALLASRGQRHFLGSGTAAR